MPEPLLADELLRNFRDAMRALVPAFDRAGTLWRPGENYDPFDDVATALYRALVAVPVIEVLPAPADGSIRVFLSLTTTIAPFDTVTWRLADPHGRVLARELFETPFDDCSFAARLLVKSA